MKTMFLFLVPVLALAQAPESLQVTDAGPHHAVWQAVRPGLDDAGQPVAVTNSWTQLETGLNWWDENSGGWRETEPAFDITGDGHGVVQRGQHKLIVSPNLNSLGAVDIQLPNGTRIRCNPAGISYYDSASGKNVLLAEIKDCVGELIAPNVIFFPDAFDTLSAGFRLVYSRAGVEADVVLFQDPGPPEAYDLDPTTTTLCSYTEIWETPEPVAKGRVTDADTGDEDPIFDFGSMRMVHGRAYLSHRQLESIGVNKVWQKLPDRRFLIEEVRYREVEPLLEKLQARVTVPDAALLAKRTTTGRSGPAELLSPRGSGRMLAALGRSTRDLGAGLILDFQLLNTGQTNFLMNGTTTYHVTGLVNLDGTTTVESGVVVKYAKTNSAELRFNGGVNWEPSPYRPAVFCAVDDDSCGEIITGSTGVPTGTYAYCALRFYTPPSALRIENVRVKHANMGIVFYGANTHELRHSQFVANSKAVYSSVSTVRLQNVLIDGCTSYALYPTGGGTMVGEHLTVKASSAVASSSGVVTLTNSVFANVTNWTATFAGAYNKTNADLSVFQTVGAGSAYLAAGSSYRDAGTTNIDARLLRELRDRTTFPPIVLTTPFATSIVLGPQAARDSNTPDCGYHYDPLDWCWSALNLTNATLILTNGAAVAWYGNSGLYLKAGAQVASQGRPDGLNRLVRYDTVQEQSTSWGGAATGGPLYQAAASPWPVVKLVFTDVACLAGPGRELVANASAGGLTVLASHCQFRGVSITPGDSAYSSSATWTFSNSLLERSTLTANHYGYFASCGLTLGNMLFHRGAVSLAANASSFSIGWTAKNCLFDSDTLVASRVTNSNNGYRSGLNVMSGSTGGDQPGLIISYQSGAATNWCGVLAGFYYPSTGATNSLAALINAGTAAASTLGLYHFTTTTNQVKEASTTVDIGYHLASLDQATGAPRDTDGDGMQDYLEDRNGNGVLDSSETDWQNASDLGLKVLILRPRDNAVLP